MFGVSSFFTAVLLLFLCLALKRSTDRQIKELNEKLSFLERCFMGLSNKLLSIAPDPETGKTEATPKKSKKTPEIQEKIEKEHTPPLPSSSFSEQPPKILRKKKKLSAFEQDFGAKLATWVGAVALIFAGFYLVKYSIESGLLTPAVRLGVGLLFALLFQLAGHKIRTASSVENAPKIAQALSGAGIAIAYLSIFAATSYYSILSPLGGFAGMFLLTLYAIYASVSFGPPVALLGLIGGFATPIMISTGSHNGLGLFMYLALLSAAFFYLIQKQKWVFLGFFLLMFSGGYVMYWLPYYEPEDAIGIFTLMAVLAFGLVRMTELTGKITLFNEETSAEKVAKSYNHVGMTGIFLLSFIVLGRAHFDFPETLLFSTFAFAGLVTTYFKFDVYRFLPILTGLFSALMILSFKSTLPETLIVLGVYGGISVLCSSFFFRKTTEPYYWGTYNLISLLAVYLIAYFKLKGFAEVSSIPLLWGGLAAAGALWCLQTISYVNENCREGETKEKLAGLFAMGTTAFISLAIAIELDKKFLAPAFASQLFATAYLGTKISIHKKDIICKVLLGLTGLVLLADIVGVVLIALTSIVKGNSFIFRNYPLFEFGIPTLMTAAAAYYQKDKTTPLSRDIQSLFLVFLTLFTYFFVRELTGVKEYAMADFVQRGMITAVFFCLSIFVIRIGQWYKLPVFYFGGEALFFLSVARTLYFDILIYNPYMFYADVGMPPILNKGILNYLVPIIVAGVLVRHIKPSPKATNIARIFICITSFFFVCFETAQFYRGAFLYRVPMSSAEMYTYSAVWILSSGILLTLGIIYRSQQYRIASLILMILTTFKIFLFDASSLEGLYRVFSFFGLGISLLAISYLYSRFIIEKKES